MSAAGHSSNISLPVVEDVSTKSDKTTISRSKMGKRRAIVLLTVQAVLIVHVLLWALGAFGGWTTTPIEPSESMEFSKHGVINVGLIFFLITLLSTVILGRWFCGWGCHVLLLQDACGWLMKKCRIRPKPFRSRLLIYVPLALALYMFIWPVVYRWGVVPIDAWMGETLGPDNVMVSSVRTAFAFSGVHLPAGEIAPWKTSFHMTTQSFWKTFAGIAVAIPFLGICGFASVYFLGSKGFCTYGCPYGGFFAPLDEYAPARIRVTDACEQCGHCTAVCTSNVRVHEEVREYGAVVDPGCMKCMDCVSVCPNDALYFGFGKPAVMKGAPKNKAPKPNYDLTWKGEIALAMTFAVAFFSFRGLYGITPMLMAAGIGGCVAFLAWIGWRLLREQNVSMHRRRLKYRGALQPAGWVWAAVIALVMVLTLHSAVVKAALKGAEYFDHQVTIPERVVFSDHPVELDPPMREDANRALGLYQFASAISAGGIGLLSTNQPSHDIRRIWLLCAQLRFEEAESLLFDAIERNGQSETFAKSLALVLRGQREHQQAIDYYRKTLLANPGYHQMLGDFAMWCTEQDMAGVAIDLCRTRLERFPDDLPTLRWLSRLLMDAGELDKAIALIERTIEIDPDHAPAHATLARAYARAGRYNEATQAMNQAVELGGENPAILMDAAGLLNLLGRTEKAKQYTQRAKKLRGSSSSRGGH